jgi:pilus assembly protein CpaB
MGKLKAVIPIMLALVIALLGSVFLYNWLRVQTAPKEVVASEVETVPVTVAALDLPLGTKLEAGMLKTVPFIEESLPVGRVSDADSLKNRVLISAVRQNEPITEYKLASKDVTVGGVAAIVKPGKRAVAVKGDKVIGISGFIRPGNHVDVLVTLTDPRNKRETTKIVLENILVLATGTLVQEDGKGKPAPVDVYTLEVTPQEAEKLALASSKGKLQFALRNATDEKTVLTSGATIPKALGSLNRRKSTRSGVPERTYRVEVIKGNDVSERKLSM